MELKSLLDALHHRGGSDLHLVAGQPPIFRVDGALERPSEDPLTGAEIEGMLTPYLTSERLQIMRQARQGAEISIREEGRPYHCLILLEHGRLTASIRAIPRKVPTLEDLELPDLMQPILDSRRGLVLVTGPTGSGKSTTTAAMIETLNRTTERRILTFEDPIEYEFVSKRCVISQHAVGQDVANYETGLRMAFRSDADIVLIGEMRTLDSLILAMTLAENPHLVFTVLHTANVSDSLRRIIEVCPEPRDSVRHLLARALTAVVSQRLLPRIDRAGRVAANEILIATPAIRRMISEGQTDMTMAIEAGRNQGMQSMDDSILKHYKNGVISYDTAWLEMLDRERLGRPASATP